MSDVYCGATSVISFGKVPCTPVTGAYVNFYDIFGDVERIGTGSSCGSSSSTAGGGSDEQVERNSIMKTPPVSSPCRRCTKYNTSFDTASVLQTDPYIVFLQDKQVEVLGALHEEIRELKRENSDLKFQIHVILQQDSSLVLENLRTNPFSSKVHAVAEPNDTSDTFGRISNAQNRGKVLSFELESATKMIEELKWIQQHYEKKIRMQELRIDELETRLNNRDNMEEFPIQMTIPDLHATRANSSTSSRHLKSGRRRSSSVHPPNELNDRRNSLQSILPDNYKEQVATLPPISTSPSENTAVLRCNTGVSSRNASHHPSNKNSSMKVRKSSVNHSPTGNNNTAGLLGEDPGQYKGQAQFYYSK